MSRCTCCQVVLSQTEMLLDNEDGSFNDLCFHCIGIVNHPEYSDRPEYAFSDITEVPIFHTVKRPHKLND